MIGSLIGLIFLCIVLGIVWWAAQTLISKLHIAEPFATAVYVIMLIRLTHANPCASVSSLGQPAP